MLVTESAFLNIEIREDIMFVQIKANTCFDLNKAHTTILTRLEKQPHKKHKIISYLQSNVSSTKPAREYSGSAEIGQFTTANAVITQSYISKTTINFFLQLVKPNYPIRFFTNEEDAKLWLNTFKDETLDPEVVRRYVAKITNLQKVNSYRI